MATSATSQAPQAPQSTSPSTTVPTPASTSPDAPVPITESLLHSLLQTRLSSPSPSQTQPTPPLHIEVVDQSGGCGQSFAALVVSDVFLGKGVLARHRLVNGVLKEEIKQVHAWEVRCLTGAEWEKVKEKEKERGGG